jgi:protein KIBRA
LKEQLEAAKAAGDSERMSSLLDDERLLDLLQTLPQPVDPLTPQGKESLKMEKLLKKTSREIYKLRKSRTPRGKPDVISFK